MRFLLLLLLSGFTTFATAQNSIDATEIIAMLDAGKDVSLNNTTIKGDLDFTRVADYKRENKSNWDKQKAYRCYVRNRLSFTECTFTGAVLGYRNTKNGKKNWNGNGELYNADFYETVTFKDCTFRERANFKYSHFLEGANFSESRFAEGAGFKYTRFDEYARFSRVKMAGKATFKYTSFPDGADFSYANFADAAVFKYVKFSEGVDMSHADFAGRADFKYTQFKGEVDLTETDFGRSADFKYTKLNGRSFRGGKG